MQYIGLIVGFVLLIKCADWFVDGSSNLAKALGVTDARVRTYYSCSFGTSSSGRLPFLFRFGFGAE